MTANPTPPLSTCPCPHGVRPLGRLHNVDMGKGVVRLSTDPACRIHNEHRYVGDGTEPCRFCGLKRLYWSAHKDVRPEMMRRLR